MNTSNFPIVKTDASPLRLISIIPNFLGKEDYLADLILQRYQRTLICDYAMSYSLHPQGDNVMDKVSLMAKSFRKLKALLAGKPVRLGILFQSLVGHGGLWANNPGGPTFQRVISADGTKSIRPCPAGKLFLDYVHDAVKTVVAEGPAFTLTDDDLRMSNNACFCDEHMRRFSQRMGRTYTREELVAELEKTEPHAKISTVFEEIQRESMNEVCSVVRKTLDEFDPHLCCGCCLVCDRLDYAEPQRDVLKGDAQESFLRIGNSYYMEGAIKNMLGANRRTGYSIINLRNKGFDLLDESDTCPHNRYSKSARTMHLHIATGMINGLDGCKLWFDQSAMPMHEISRPYEDIFGKHQGFYRELHRIAHTWHTQGLFTPIPAPDREPLPHRGIEFIKSADWLFNCFGLIGFPTFYETFDHCGIRLLAGKEPDYFTDDEIKTMLADKLILDGPAAAILTRRGFAPLMGAAVSTDIVQCTTEANEDASWTTIMNPCFTITSQNGAEVMTWCLNIAYKGAASTTLAPASTYIRNELGGQVIVSAIDLENFHPIRVVNPARKLQYISWLDKLGGVPAYLPETQDANLLCGTMADGSLGCFISNFSYDPLDVRIALQKQPKKAFELMPEGDFRELPVSWENGIASVPKTLEPAVITFIKFLQD